jgi:hypothetical protein
MNKLEFLKFALRNKVYRKQAWLISAFSVISEPTDKWKSDPYVGRIVQQPFGFFFVDQERNLVKIDDAKSGEPLFAMLDELEIDQSWIDNCSKPTKTLVGSLLVNYILLIESFGTKIPYMADNITIRKIEKFVVDNRNDPKNPDPSKITLDEYLSLAKGIELLKTVTNLSVYSLTPKNLVPPPGFKEKKAALIKEYEGQLKDPVKLAEFEERLMEIDKEHMKGDPSYGKLVSGKVHRNARRKLVLASGAEGGLNGIMVPVTESLAEGVPLTPENFAAQVNGSRSGSYFRGVDTVKGGVSSKRAVRAVSAYTVEQGDCGTTLGVLKSYNKFNIDNLVGRVIVGSKKPVENISEAENYLGKSIRVRSPAYCKLSTTSFCEMCAGFRLARFKDGLIIPATDLTSAIMAASMAAMHNNVTSAAVFDLESNVS